MSSAGQPVSVPRPPVPPPLSGRGALRPTDEQEDFGALVKRTAQDAAHLVEQESKLLKREIELKLERAQATVAIGAVGAIGALLTLLSATATAIFALSLVLPGWAAALILTALWAVVSAMGLGWAKKRFDAQTPQPQITERSVRRDMQALGQAT